MNILVVEDNKDLGSILVQVIEVYSWGKGYLATSPEEAGELLNQVRLDVVLVDYYLNELTDFDKVMKLVTKIPKVIVITAANIKSEFFTDNYRIHSVVRKPFDLDELGKILLQ